MQSVSARNVRYSVIPLITCAEGAPRR
jgi:hypothetical protein